VVPVWLCYAVSLDLEPVLLETEVVVADLDLAFLLALDQDALVPELLGLLADAAGTQLLGLGLVGCGGVSLEAAHGK